MNNKIKKIIVTFMVCLLAVNIVNGTAFAADYNREVKRTNLPGSYGKLKGEVVGHGADLIKNFASYADSTKKVPRIRAKLSVEYYKSGDNIGPGDSTGWITNEKTASTGDYDLHHWRNKEKNTDSGFRKTTCVGYGTADAIIEKAYAVYTKVIY